MPSLAALPIIPQPTRPGETMSINRTVEGTFAWLSRSRRLARDHERLPETGEAIIHTAISRVTLRRIAA